MIPLWSKIAKEEAAQSIIGRISEDPLLPEPLRSFEVLLLRADDQCDASGFQGVLRIGAAQAPNEIGISEQFGYLADGDIVRIAPSRGEFRVLYRRASRHNVLFFTERCNSRCLMCSQPPREIEDGYLIDDLLEAIPLMDRETPELTITGGEPMLLGPRVFEVISAVKEHLPSTALHMLTNGRLFSDPGLAKALASVNHPDFMIGIPLYADVAHRHDFVVQAKGAFDQTIRGLLNLASAGVRIEIRIVIHRQTIDRLVETCSFIVRNLPFVDQVALMGLEITGFTKANLEALWIDPFEYQDVLAQAVQVLVSGGIRALIYNHPLCLLPQTIWPHARRSISDWKNLYFQECEECAVRAQCGGFFASATTRHSSRLSRFTTNPASSVFYSPAAATI